MSRTKAVAREQGQALPILAIAVAGLLAMTALIVDGGNAMAQHRATQNATDAAALAGATVMVQNVGQPGSKTSGDVSAAIDLVLTANVTDRVGAVYVRLDESQIGPVSNGGGIPAEAYGVQVTGAREFATYLAPILGWDQLGATASATALAGPLTGACEGCPVLPVTFPVQITTCDGTNRSINIGTDWLAVPIDTALADRGGVFEAIIPLCSNGPGDVGWLDFGKKSPFNCGDNLADWIDPDSLCNAEIDAPDWLHASTGNVNDVNVENNLNTYRDKIVGIPLFDGTCRDDPGERDCPTGREGTGTGDNYWYHIPRVAAFLLDEAFIQGNNHPECNMDPGYPKVGGNGSTGCLKGWFIDLVSLGEVGDGSGQGGNPTVLGIQLVR